MNIAWRIHVDIWVRICPWCNCYCGEAWSKSCPLCICAINTNLTLLLQGLPFQQVKHVVSTLDAQPSGVDGSAILILVTGQLLVSGNSRTADINTNEFYCRSTKSKDPCLTARHSNSIQMEREAISFSTISSSWFTDKLSACSRRKHNREGNVQCVQRSTNLFFTCVIPITPRSRIKEQIHISIYISELLSEY